MSLNVDKTEIIIFKHNLKKITFDFKVKLDGKRLVFQDCVNYLRGSSDRQSVKLVASPGKGSQEPKTKNEVLSRIRYYLPNVILKKVYFALISFNIDLCHSGLGPIIGL